MEEASLLRPTDGRRRRPNHLHGVLIGLVLCGMGALDAWACYEGMRSFDPDSGYYMSYQWAFFAGCVTVPVGIALMVASLWRHCKESD